MSVPGLPIELRDCEDLKTRPKRKVSSETITRCLQSPFYKKIVRSFAYKYNRIDRDELDELAMVGLWKALMSHDFSHKTALTTSIRRYVGWQCQSYLRTRQRLYRRNTMASRSPVTIENYEFWVDMGPQGKKYLENGGDPTALRNLFGDYECIE